MFIFSIIIPTHNRFDKLIKVLNSLNSQKFPKSQFEVVIIDDGSTDKNYENLDKLQKKYDFIILTIRQVKKGAAAARNAGIKVAQGKYVLFLGDDTVSDSNLLYQHTNTHEKCPNDCVLGFIDWDKNLTLNELMKFIAPYGPQFNFRITNPKDCGFKRFYTSNISVPKTILDHYRFNEDFPSCNFEDVELGYRLYIAGVKIIYNKHAVVYHNHYYNLDSFLERQRKVGKNKRVLLKIHPELNNLWSNLFFLKLILIKDNVSLFLAKCLRFKKLYFKSICEKTWIEEFLK